MLLCALRAGLLALGHLHGVSTARPREQSDLDLAKDLMATCNELYRRTPAGLAPEIAFFTPRAGDDFPKRHAGDVGGGDFTIKPQARPGRLQGALLAAVARRGICLLCAVLETPICGLARQPATAVSHWQ